jgi:hypothetical protein
MPRRAFLLSSLLFVVTLSGPSSALAATQNFTLSLASLPSAQGLAYSASGSHAGTPEASVFSAGGGVLTQNSMGLGHGVAGGGILYLGLSGLLNATEPKQLRVSARCLQVEGSGLGSAGQQGFAFGFSTGSVQYDVSLTPTQIYALTTSSSVLVPGTYDNTQFHDYVLEFNPPNNQRIYRDGVLVYNSTSGFSLAANRIFFGDGTGGANARAEIRSLQFLQNYATPAQSTSWGRVKQLFR